MPDRIYRAETDDYGVLTVDRINDRYADDVDLTAADIARHYPDVIYFTVSAPIDPKMLLAEFAGFSERCEENQYTDTGDAWYFLDALADALRKAVS